MLAQKGLFRVLLGVAMGIGGGFGLTMMIFPYGIIQLLGTIPFELSDLSGLAIGDLNPHVLKSLLRQRQMSMDEFDVLLK